MTQPTGVPGKGDEVLQSQIQNPNLPEGFEITQEMLLNPAVKFFLENYVGGFNVDVKAQLMDGRRVLCFYDTEGNIITETGSVIKTESQGLRMELDFAKVEGFLYARGFLLDGGNYTADNHEKTSIDILKHFLPPSKRKEFEQLFSITSVGVYWANEVGGLIGEIHDIMEHLMQLDVGTTSNEMKRFLEGLRASVIAQIEELFAENGFESARNDVPNKPGIEVSVRVQETVELSEQAQQRRGAFEVWKKQNPELAKNLEGKITINNKGITIETDAGNIPFGFEYISGKEFNETGYATSDRTGKEGPFSKNKLNALFLLLGGEIWNNEYGLVKAGKEAADFCREVIGMKDEITWSCSLHEDVSGQAWCVVLYSNEVSVDYGNHYESYSAFSSQD